MDDFEFEQRYRELQKGNFSTKNEGYVTVPQRSPEVVRQQIEPRIPSRAEQIVAQARQELQPASQPVRRAARPARQRSRMRRPAFMDDLPPLWGVDAACALVTLMAAIPVIADWQTVSRGVVVNIAQIMSLVLGVGLFVLLIWLGYMAIRSSTRRGRW